ncbi:hypothetical protein SAMN05421678_103163 [Actinopolymorpha cephalotaxi]|uniref:Uncharacterized protein n=1 Tax=Actinopolymorpha cephalotaxi TaxID=504797 RepID=A0A1I2N8A9_9ACTN|nr:hypothetical protein [Actinopolymorpha cephalotaxi]NYH85732.1 hypothetical protein [Actinopolymorpha cephalotaxi]SFF97621.1 hypothetical protein SAMN05421678_103163 [Actinopolymorpha cephalotaxi]
MNFPLVAIDRGNWVGVFDSVAEFTGYVEWVAVLDDEYQLWDATGRRLQFHATTDGRIEVASTRNVEPEALRNRLAGYISAATAPLSAATDLNLRDLSLIDLIEACRPLE